MLLSPHFVVFHSKNLRLDFPSPRKPALNAARKKAQRRATTSILSATEKDASRYTDKWKSPLVLWERSSGRTSLEDSSFHFDSRAGSRLPVVTVEYLQVAQIITPPF